MSYIKIDRKILDWEWYRNLNTCRLFFHLLLKANWKDGRFEGKEIPKGSFVSSVARLAEETDMTPREIRTGLDHLKSTGEVTIKSYSKYSVFTVTNYHCYQDCDKQATNSRQTNDKQTTSKRQTNDKRTTTIEEKKEIKEGKNNKIVQNVVTHLNVAAGTRYRYQTESTKRVITARLSDGYTEKDLLTVIDKKTEEWKGTDMEKFLRPQTLFGGKFENYLNQPRASGKKENKNSFNHFPQRERSIAEMSALEKTMLHRNIREIHAVD